MRNMPWKALIPGLIAILLVQALFVLAYVVATAAPKPDRIPFGVVGSQENTSGFGQKVQELAGSALEVRAFAREVDARTAIEDQQIFGAFVSTGRSTAILYTASAAGASVARVLSQAVPKAAATRGVTVTVQDLAPLPASDINGLVVFYVALACVVYGFSGTSMALGAAPKLSLPGQVAVIAGFSAAGGLVTALVAGPITGALHMNYLPFAAIGALTMFVAGLFTALALELGGQKATLVVLIVLLVLGSPSSGGSVAPDLLPWFFRLIGQWLPPGAAVSALRNSVYFPDHQHAMPVVVLVGWAAACLLGFVLARRRTLRQRSRQKAAERSEAWAAPLLQ